MSEYSDYQYVEPPKPMKPTVTQKGDSEIYTHPAFGMVSAHHINSSSTLFGSDIKHQGVIQFTVSTAQMERSLNQDWFHGKNVLIKFVMSTSQFAELMTSMNRSATPCTLTRVKGDDGNISMVPDIIPNEERFDQLKNDVDSCVKRSLKDLQEQVQRLSVMSNSGKTSLKEVRDIQRKMEILMENLPKNLEYSMDCAKETIEKNVSKAKVEIESYVSQKAKSLGLSDISQNNKDVDLIIDKDYHA